MIELNTVNNAIVNKSFNNVKDACKWLKETYADAPEDPE